jgi:hypothetical protein
MSSAPWIDVDNDEQDVRDYDRRAFPRLGHQHAAAPSGRDLVERCRAPGGEDPFFLWAS